MYVGIGDDGLWADLYLLASYGSYLLCPVSSSLTKMCNNHENNIHSSLSLILLITLIYRYFHELPCIKTMAKHIISLFEVVHSVYSSVQPF